MSSIAKKGVETFVTRVAMQIFSAGGGVAIARTLGPTGKGEFAYAGAILVFALMATCGHTDAVFWQYGKRRLPPMAIIRVMILVVVAVCAPIVLGLVLIGLLIPSQASLLFVAAAVPPAVFAQSASGLLLGDGDVRPINLQQVFPSVLATLVYVPLLLFVYRSISVPLTAWAAAYAVGGIYMALVLRRYRSSASAGDLKPLAREQLTFGSQACLSSLGAFLDFRIAFFVIMFMLGNAALGVYSIGIALGEFLWHVSNAMIFPALKDIGGTDEARAAEVTAKCMRHSFLLVLLGAVFVAILARRVVPLVYGPAFSYGAVVTIALLPGIIAYSMMPALASFFSQQLGRPRIPFYFSALSTVLCGVVTVLTLPHFGIIAAAMATSISFSAAFAAALIYFGRRTGLGGRRIFALSADDLRPYYSLLTSCVGAIRGR
jgi:O-antigen/teichoic acid export membrane protein